MDYETVFQVGTAGWSIGRDYKTLFADAYLLKLEKQMRAEISTGKNISQSWCIFDNTTLGHATRNALALTEALN